MELCLESTNSRRILKFIGLHNAHNHFMHFRPLPRSVTTGYFPDYCIRSDTLSARFLSGSTSSISMNRNMFSLFFRSLFAMCNYFYRMPQPSAEEHASFLLLCQYPFPSQNNPILLLPPSKRSHLTPRIRLIHLLNFL